MHFPDTTAELNRLLTEKYVAVREDTAFLLLSGAPTGSG